MQSSLSQISGEDCSESSFDSDVKKALRQLHYLVDKRTLVSIIRPQHQITLSKLNSHGTAPSSDDNPEPPALRRAATSPHNESMRTELPTWQSRPALPHSTSNPPTNSTDLRPPTYIPALAADIDSVTPRRKPSDPPSYTTIQNSLKWNVDRC